MTVLEYFLDSLSIYQLQLVEPWNSDESWPTVQFFHVENIVISDTISGFNIVSVICRRIARRCIN